MRYVVFLRAINVGNRRIRMADLEETFVSAGYDDVATHLASGNLILASPTRPDPAEMTQVVEDAFGFTSESFIRSEFEVREIVTRSPWAHDAALVEVSLLADEPGAVAAAELVATATEPEALAVIGREVYFLREGKGIETVHKEATTARMLGQQTTRRGLRTFETLIARHLDT